MAKKNSFIAIFMAISFFFNFQRSYRIEWDVFGYYLYLPAKFIYNDLPLDNKAVWLDPLIKKYNTTDNLYQAYPLQKGKYVMKYTMGLSIVYAPFFFCAHFIANLFNYQCDGFSPPYQWAMMLCSIFFTFLGLLYLFKILERFFKQEHAFICSVFLAFGTNFFIISIHDGLMPHNFLFAIFGILLFYNIKWLEEPKTKFILIIGGCIGLATLIRPTSIVVIIVPLLWNIQNINEFKTRLTLLWQYKWQLIILICTAFVIVLPQLVYWKNTTDHFFFYSYPDEKLDFGNSHLMQVLFSYKKGWFVYTPIMILFLTGFIFLYKKYRPTFYPIIVFLIVNTYIISCWDCWWYGGSFAQRPFVESYVFLCFPFAAFIEYVSYKKIIYRLLFYSICIALTYLNLFQTHQALNGVLHTSLTTKEYYWRIFLKNEATDEDKRWLEPSTYSDGSDSLPSNFKRLTIFKTESVQTTKETLNNEKIFSKKILAPTDIHYNIGNHYLIAHLLIDTQTCSLPNNKKVHLVVCIKKKNELYKYRSFDYSFEDLLKQREGQSISVLIPPQCGLGGYEISEYIYVDSDARIDIIKNEFEITKIQY